MPRKKQEDTQEQSAAFTEMTPEKRAKIEATMRAREDKDSRITKLAVTPLGMQEAVRAYGPEIMKGLLDMSRSRDPEVRLKAIKELLAIGYGKMVITGDSGPVAGLTWKEKVELLKARKERVEIDVTPKPLLIEINEKEPEKEENGTRDNKPDTGDDDNSNRGTTS